MDKHTHTRARTHRDRLKHTLWSQLSSSWGCQVVRSRSSSAASDLCGLLRSWGLLPGNMCIWDFSFRRRRETQTDVGRVGVLVEVKASAEEMKAG